SDSGTERSRCLQRIDLPRGIKPANTTAVQVGARSAEVNRLISRRNMACISNAYTASAKRNASPARAVPSANTATAVSGAKTAGLLGLAVDHSAGMVSSPEVASVASARQSVNGTLTAGALVNSCANDYGDQFR